MAIHTAFAKELARLYQPDDRFFALFGQDYDFNPAPLKIVNGIRHVTLGEDYLAAPIFRYGFSRSDSGQKHLRIERMFGHHELLLEPDLCRSRCRHAPASRTTGTRKPRPSPRGCTSRSVRGRAKHRP